MSAPIQHLLSVPMCGLPCAFCGQPVRLIKIYPRGIRTMHEDDRLPPCDDVPPPTKPQASKAVTPIAHAPRGHAPRGHALVRPPSAAHPVDPLRRESRCA